MHLSQIFVSSVVSERSEFDIQFVERPVQVCEMVPSYMNGSLQIKPEQEESGSTIQWSLAENQTSRV